MRKKFKNYRIVKELSSSMWTSVYKAIQEPLDRPVSLKILDPRMTEEEELVQRFEREAKICANLVHPNIVRLFDYGSWRGEYYIVQEWVEGESLKELLKKRSPPLDLGLFIIREAAEGLAHAHFQGVVHRDIKPGNILISQSGSVKLTDFGLARSLSLPEITLEGTFLGTPAYSSPEQLKGGEINKTSDVFSLGVASYEILAGVNPFAGEAYSEIIDKVCHLRPKPLDKVNPSVPSGVARLVQRMLAKTPGRRYQDLEHFLDDLKGAVSLHETVVSGATLASYLKAPAQVPKPPSTRRRRLPLWVYPVFAGVAGASILLLALRPYLQKLGSGSSIPAISETTGGADSVVVDTPIVKEPAVVSKAEAEREPDKPLVHTESFLRFQVKPWAKIYVDGSYWETTPTDRICSLDPGQHTLRLLHDYLPPYEDEILVQSGETLTVNVDLLAHSGWIALSVRPWGEVYIDGTHIGTTPLSGPIAIRPGPHRLLITHPSLASSETIIDIKPGDTLSKIVTLKERS